MPEPGSAPDMVPESLDRFYNLDEADKALASDNPATLSEIRQFCLEKQDMNEEQFELAVANQRLRLDVLKGMKREIRERMDSHPEPTPFELNMGAYIEMVEPTVREATIEMRRKGYNTVSSGFAEYGVQSMAFSDSLFDVVSEDVLNTIRDSGIEISDDGSAVFFNIKEATVESIKKQWDEFAAMLPDLDRETSPHPTGDLFRERVNTDQYKYWEPRIDELK